MGFLSPNMPVVDQPEWRMGSRSERMKPLTRHIVDAGMGFPYAFYLLYPVKIALYILGGIGFALATTGIDGWGNIGTWWSEPIVFQKVVLWSLLFEVLGLGCSFGPLAGRLAPPLGSPLYWLRTGTIRLPPWPARIPLTAGDSRTPIEVFLYAALLVATLNALLSNGTGPVPALQAQVGLIPEWKIAVILVVLALIGLRDKVIFLAARGEVYGALAVTFMFPGVTMIVAAKLVMLAIWLGAATSKINSHFPFVIATMVSNNPLVQPKALKRLFFRHFPDDLRPGLPARLSAHIGTVVEFGVPLVLFFSHGGAVTRIAALVMVVFHLIILTSVPLGVPLEWNVFMIFGIATLFVDKASLGLRDLRLPWACAVIALMSVLVANVVISNLYPRRVSFLPGMRYYAGNWDVSMWCLTRTATEKIASRRIGLGLLPHMQTEKFYGAEGAEVPNELSVAWRAMSGHGRGVVTLMKRAIPAGREREYAVLDGEQVAAYALGWMFGDGHLHNEQLITALQSRCHFEPGDVRVIILDGQPIHRQAQEYRLIDAATGEFERGSFRVADCTARQPWEDDVPLRVATATT